MSDQYRKVTVSRYRSVHTVRLPNVPDPQPSDLYMQWVEVVTDQHRFRRLLKAGRGSVLDSKPKLFGSSKDEEGFELCFHIADWEDYDEASLHVLVGWSDGTTVDSNDHGPPKIKH